MISIYEDMVFDVYGLYLPQKYSEQPAGIRYQADELAEIKVKHREVVDNLDYYLNRWEKPCLPHCSPWRDQGFLKTYQEWFHTDRWNKEGTHGLVFSATRMFSIIAATSWYRVPAWANGIEQPFRCSTFLARRNCQEIDYEVDINSDQNYLVETVTGNGAVTGTIWPEVGVDGSLSEVDVEVCVHTAGCCRPLRALGNELPIYSRYSTELFPYLDYLDANTIDDYYYQKGDYWWAKTIDLIKSRGSNNITLQISLENHLRREVKKLGLDL